jgi:hypothetical protein
MRVHQQVLLLMIFIMFSASGPFFHKKLHSVPQLQLEMASAKFLNHEIASQSLSFLN